MELTKKNKTLIMREKRANAVCREVRFQMADRGGIYNNEKLFKLLSKWMRVAKKDKYTRPK